MTRLHHPLSSAQPRTGHPHVTVIVRSAAIRERIDALAHRLGAPIRVLDEPPLRANGDSLVLVDGSSLAGALEVVQCPLWGLSEAADAREHVSFRAAGVERVFDVHASAAELIDALDAIHDDAREDSGPALSAIESKAPSMSRLIEMAHRLAAARSSVLLTGETGVGKEYLARAMHAESERAGQPFLTVNCGALPESLLESHLFGHVKGAFTGASSSREGFFQAAGGGTLLLDEIGEMPAHLQVALLNVLERKEVTPVGGCKPVPVRARVMAATNRDLARGVQEGTFREDLYYRLNVVHLEVPPLRERTEDLPDLVGQAIWDFRDVRPGERVRSITDAALGAIRDYRWPGNVRELRNAIERAILLGEGPDIRIDDLPDEVRANECTMHLGDIARNAPDPGEWLCRPLRDAREAAIEAVERHYLRKVLQTTHGRIDETARIAGIGTRSLYDKMKRYELRKEEFKCLQ